MQHRYPNRRDFADLLKFKKPTFSATQRRLARAQTIADLRADRPSGHAQGAVRLHRRCGGGGAVARAGPSGVPRHRVPPGDPARRLDRRHLVRGARRRDRTAVRHRADRLHPDDARPRARRPAPPRPARPAFRSRCRPSAPRRSRTSRPQPERSQLVPALHVARPRTVDGADGAGGGGRVRHAARHRRRAGGRCAAARWLNGLTIPPTSPPARSSTRSHACVVVQLPHHRTDQFATFKRWDGTVAELLDSMFDPSVTFDDLRVDQGAVAGQGRGEGRADARRRQAARRHGCRRGPALQPRRTPTRPGARPVPPAPRRRQGGRPRHRGAPRHRHHVGRRHRRRDRARRTLHVGRSRISLRADGRRPRAVSTGRSRSSPRRSCAR